MPPATKEKVFQAAIKTFARKGYKGATVREICKKAGAANLNAVVYYFNGKENLYKEVLEFMFQDARKFIPPEEALQSVKSDPEKRLGLFILIYTRIIYAIESELDADLAAIFAKEATNPSPFLSEMVQRYLVPTNERLRVILRDILGADAPPAVIRDCEASVMGQIYYHMFAWPLIIRSDPEYPAPRSRIESMADHITRFTLGGLAALKEGLAAETK